MSTEGPEKLAAAPAAAAPPVLHICGATDVHVKDLQIGKTQTSTEPGVLVTSTCDGDDDDDADDVEQNGRRVNKQRQSSVESGQHGAAPPAYKAPPRILPASIGTGSLSVSFHRVHTLGGGYASSNPILIRGLKRGDLCWMEMVSTHRSLLAPP